MDKRKRKTKARRSAKQIAATRRLVALNHARRRARRVKRNPRRRSSATTYRFCVERKDGGAWIKLACFQSKRAAADYARALHQARPRAYRVTW